MSGLHTWTGLLLGWVLYAMFLTGTVSFFKEELSQWMRPELPRVTQALNPAVVAQRVADEIGRIAPSATQWSIKLPDDRSNSVYAFWRLPVAQDARGFGEGHFDPVTGRQVEARGTLGGDFFYRFHFQFVFLNMPTLQQPEAYVGGIGDAFGEDGALVKDSLREFLQKYIDAFAGFVAQQYK
jgi:uncharacterized iron-regulated membrane protein